MNEAKMCARCREAKNLDQFNWKIKAEGRRQAYCRLCSRAYGKEHYGANPEYYKKKAHQSRKKEMTE